MRTRRLLLLVATLTLAVGCGSKAPPEEQGSGAHANLNARIKAHTVAETATATGTQTSTGTATGSHVATVTVTSTSTAVISATDWYTVNATVTGTVKVTAYYLSWTGTSTNTTTNTRTTTVVGPVQSTSVFTNIATNTVTNSRNGTETKTITAATTGFVTFTGTTTVTVTNTVTSTAGARQGSGTKTITATGTAVQNGTALWTWHQTGTVTQTATQSDTRVITNTGTVTQTLTLTSTATDTATGACLGLWRSTTCGQWCLQETQADRKVCQQYLDCYLNHGCGPTTCGGVDDICGVNVVRPASGTAPKIIADQVYQCMGCAGSTPTTSCSGLPDMTPCDDNNACTTNDRCLGGACTMTTPVTCTALDQCHNAGTCNPNIGCSNPNKPDGTACNDSNECTQVDSCLAGSCTGSALVTCTPLDQCHDAGKCAPATGVCSNPPKAGGPNDVHPTAICVKDKGSGYYEALFGYTNPNKGEVTTIPVGDNNHFLSAPAGLGQPEDFYPTTMPAAFSVLFNGDSLTWVLPGGCATVSSSTTACPTTDCSPACRTGEKCVGGKCVTQCGDGLCAGDENCISCPADCGCSAGLVCLGNTCAKPVQCGGDSWECGAGVSFGVNVDCGSCPNGGACINHICQ